MCAFKNKKGHFDEETGFNSNGIGSIVVKCM